jgi:hypothetical protein
MVISVGEASAPFGTIIVKSDPGSDRVPPSGPITAETLCSTPEWFDPHLTARAWVPLESNVYDARTINVGGRSFGL